LGHAKCTYLGWICEKYVRYVPYVQFKEMNIFLALFVKTTWLGNLRCIILTILCHFLIVDSSVPDILIFCSDPYSGVELVTDPAR
jgi:hypothetical protein